LILYDVLDWQTAEVAEVLGQTIPSVKSALHRARTTLNRHYSEFHRKTIKEQLADEALQSRLTSYMKARKTALLQLLPNFPFFFRYISRKL
jgi:RNA polymerase sigma-70 factor (ECF subfamily)